MRQVIIQSNTTHNPITLIGMEAGLCWGANTEDDEKNYKRGIDCLESNHGRALEFPQVYMTIEGYSAKMCRELFTHCAGAPTRLQASTRYINYADFPIVVPPKIDADDEAKGVYLETAQQIRNSIQKLKDLGVPNEDATMLLPLGMESKMVLRTNLRHLIDMSHQRECQRAYWEFRNFMRDMKNALRAYDEQWAYLVDTYFMPKCEMFGYCPEKNGCGRFPRKEEN